MDGNGRSLAEQFGRVMAGGEIDSIVDMYASEARVISYSGIAEGHEQIGDLYRASLDFHGTYEVMTIDQFCDAGDLVMWDATVQTRAGLLQTTQIMYLGADGKIVHHVPSIRGYWGM